MQSVDGVPVVEILDEGLIEDVASHYEGFGFRVSSNVSKNIIETPNELNNQVFLFSLLF